MGPSVQNKSIYSAQYVLYLVEERVNFYKCVFYKNEGFSYAREPWSKLPDKVKVPPSN